MAAWPRARSTDPVWVRNVCRTRLGERVWSVHGNKDEEYQRLIVELPWCFVLCDPLFVLPPFRLRTGDHYLSVCTDLLKISCVPTTRPRARPLTVCGGAYESEIICWWVDHICGIFLSVVIILGLRPASVLLHVFGSPVCVRVWLCPMDPAGSFGERTLRPVALWAKSALVLLQALKSPAAL